MKQDIQAILAKHRAAIDPEVLNRVESEVAADFAILKIANDVRKARRAAGYTQAQLAQETGITQSEISRIEKGRFSPRLASLFTLARALNTDFVIPGATFESARVA